MTDGGITAINEKVREERHYVREESNCGPGGEGRSHAI